MSASTQGAGRARQREDQELSNADYIRAQMARMSAERAESAFMAAIAEFGADAAETSAAFRAYVIAAAKSDALTGAITSGARVSVAS